MEARQCATSNGWSRRPSPFRRPAAWRPTAIRRRPTGGYPSGYGYSNGYYAQPTYYPQQPTYYQPAPVVTQTRYVPVPVAQPAPQRRLRDSDHDGIPDRYERDKNGDGIPDRYQRQTSR